MVFTCNICNKTFQHERSMTSHRGWHKRYQKKFETQIRDQLRELKNMERPSTLKTKQVKFKIGRKVKKIRVRPCKPDGKCLFEALRFQTEAENYNYNEKAIKIFKKNILKTIRDDDEFYRPFIEAHLAELMNEKEWTKYFRSTEENKKKERDNLMEEIEDDEWGGSETIAAVQDMYNVNCVSFDATSETFYMPLFQKKYEGIIFVTFTGNNHYDTVMEIKEGDILEISEKLARHAI